MAPGLMERLQAKLELFRLEQRYTRRRHRRSTFVSNATYVDGEYIYNSPNSTGSSAKTGSTTTSKPAGPMATISESKAAKRLSRFPSMPGFGTSDKSASSGQDEWRSNRVSVHEVR